MIELYENIAEDLVHKVKAINPFAKVIKNYKENESIVIDLVKSYHENTGDAFLEHPFYLININLFK